VPSRSIDVSRIAGAELGHLLRPLDRVETSRGPAAVGDDLEAGCLAALQPVAAQGIDGHHHALGTELDGELTHQSGALDRGGVHGHLVGADPQQAAGIVDSAHPTADREGDEDLLGGAPGHLDDGVAGVGRGGDVEEHHLVGTLVVVASRQLDGIAGITQAHEVDALDHPPGIDIQARDHSHATHRPATPLWLGRR
jgi:hypothetical protein